MPRQTKSNTPKTGAGSSKSSLHNASVNGRRNATLEDVALLAGVVPMTASRAINNTGYVSAAVRKRVLAAAKKVHYRPNLLARKLRGRRMKAVGIVLPDISNPFSAELIAGMNEILEGQGYSPFIVTANRSPEQEKAGLRSLVEHQVDGLLVATRGTQLGDESIAEIAREGVPVVTVGRPVESDQIDCVSADHFGGSREAVKHLIAMGHTRIGFIGIAPSAAPGLRRFLGYASALNDAKIPLRESYIVGPESGPAYGTQQDGYDGLMRLAKLRYPPTAIFARNDYAAIGALRAAHELGLSVPRDIAIAGFDNIPMASFAIPPLTTVEQPIAEQGRQAARFLLERIERNQEIGRRNLQLECHLIIRESSDPKAITHPQARD